MCERCIRKAVVHTRPASRSRRTALGMMAGLPLLGLPALSSPAFAAEPPKPGNVLSPEQALERLMRGNERYTSGKTLDRDFASTRATLTAGQNPFACILSCADSRVSPELCFDEERGDLFVTRVAGNYLTNDLLASLEYGVAVLNAPLIMVLGHTSCGAISATVNAFQKPTELPGHIQTIVTALMPPVRAAAAGHASGDLVAAATLENIRHNVRQLQQATPILSQLSDAGKIKVVGGLYKLDTGQVEIVA